jgi:hypothetical protein
VNIHIHDVEETDGPLVIIGQPVHGAKQGAPGPMLGKPRGKPGKPGKPSRKAPGRGPKRGPPKGDDGKVGLMAEPTDYFVTTASLRAPAIAADPIILDDLEQVHEGEPVFSFLRTAIEPSDEGTRTLDTLAGDVDSLRRDLEMLRGDIAELGAMIEASRD